MQKLNSDLSSLSWDVLKQVVLHLGVPKHRIDDVEAMHPTSVSDRRISALDSWLQMDIQASWDKVVEALQSCGLQPMVMSPALSGPLPVPTSVDGG